MDNTEHFISECEALFILYRGGHLSVADLKARLAIAQQNWGIK